MYISGSSWWTISPPGGNSTAVFGVNGNTYSTAGRLSGSDAFFSDGVFPVLYLSSDITLTGDGTEGNPYVITN